MGKKLWVDEKDKHSMLFFCPGCKTGHGIRSRVPQVPRPANMATWDFNGDLEKPTFTPSHLTGTDNFTKHRCHSYIKDGMIQFLDDCHHELRGQTVELPDIDKDD